MNEFLLVSDLVRDAVKNNVFPNAAFAIGTPEGVLHKDWVNCNENTLYDMASVTKIMVTTALTMKFVEMGHLAVHESVSGYFAVPKDKEEITLFHLLTHTSGLPAHIMLRDAVKDPQDAVEYILNQPLVNPVGKETVYSCMGFIVLGKILERVGNGSLDALAAKYIFNPLGMADTVFNPTSKDVAATEYGAGIVHDENACFLGGVSGNAGLFSTISDTAKFAQMLAISNLQSCLEANHRRDSSGDTYAGGLFSYAAMRAFTRNYTKGMSESRGLGFSICDGRPHSLGDLFPLGSFGHNGFTGTSMYVDKETGLYVVLLTNRVFFGRENVQIINFRRKFHNFIYGIWSRVNG